MSFFQRTRYTLNSSIGTLRIGFETNSVTPDPLNWNEVDTTIGRSDRTDGIFTEIKQNLEFTKEAKNYLIRLEGKEGSEADVTLRREVFTGLKWEVRNEGALDLATMNWDAIKTSSDYIDNSFAESFKSNFSEEFELSRLNTIKDDPIDIIDIKALFLRGKEILFQSLLKTQDENHVSTFEYVNASVANPYGKMSLPLSKVYSSTDFVSGFLSDNEFFTQPIFDNSIRVGGKAPFATAQNFAYLASGEASLQNIDIKFESTISTLVYDNLSNDSYISFIVKKYTYNEDEAAYFEVGVNPITLFTSPVQDLVLGQQINIDTNIDVELEEDQFLFIGWNLETIIQPDGDAVIAFTYANAEVLFKQESFFEPTKTDAVRLFDAFAKVVEIIDPQATFDSQLLRTKWKSILIASGETIRNVLYEGEKPTVVTASFEQLYNLLYTIEPVGFDVIFDNGVKKVIVEPISYFFNRDKIIDLGVSKDNIQWNIEDKYNYGSVEIGYSDSGENEEVYGLQVTNVVNKFTTPLTKCENTYEATTKAVTDSSEIEIQRRKQFELFPDTDGQYDKNIIAFDAKQLSFSIYEIEENTTFFDSVTGIFSPETSFNIRFSPINCLLRHGNWLKSGFAQRFFNEKKVQFASTAGNTALKSTLIGEVERQENDDLVVQELENALITSRKATFEVPYSDELDSKLRGYTEGKRNAYNLLQVENRNGDLSFGYLLKAEIKNSIKIEMIQANGI